MGILQKIYNNSPIWFQNIMTSVAGYKKNKNRYGKIYYEHLEFLKNFDNLSLEKKREYQNKKLVEFVNYAYNNSPYYRKIYDKSVIENFQGVNDLEKLPILEKEEIRKNIHSIFTIKNKYVEGNTGGTTGKSLVVRFTKEDVMRRNATLDYFKSKLGFHNLIMKKATFNGQHIIPPKQKKKIFWRYNKASKQMIYSSFHITEKNLHYYVESLNKFKPHSIDGFFTSILDLASYIDRHNIELSFKPIAIFPTSETLTKNGRDLIEKVFKCKVYDQYASSEGAPFIVEDLNQIPRVDFSSGVFETYKYGENNEVLVTSFTTHGTPLIRYRIGDSVIFEDEKEGIVKEIQGRKLDFLYTSEGAKINAGNVANLFKNIPNALIRAQCIQHTMNQIEILLEIDKDKYKPVYDQMIKNEFYSKFGKQTNLVIKHVNEIPREKSGKFVLIKNKVRN